MFGDAIAAALPGMRARAEALMVDTLHVDRPGAPVMDPVTGATTYPLTALYTGPGKVQASGSQENTQDAQGHVTTIQRLEVHVPIGAFSPAVGDLVTVTASALDPTLVGRTMRVVALAHKSMATAQRLPVEEVTA